MLLLLPAPQLPSLAVGSGRIVAPLLPGRPTTYAGNSPASSVPVEQYWREISTGLAQHAIPVRHFVLHADQDTLRGRIEGEHPVPSPFRLKYLEPYAEAARTWLHSEAEVIDTTHLTPAQAAQQIAVAVKS